MNARFPVLSALLLLAPAALASPWATEVLSDDLDETGTWTCLSTEGVQCEHDPAQGHEAPGSLRLVSSSSEGAGSWTRCLPLPTQREQLLRVTGRVRTRGVQGQARLVAAVQDEHGALAAWEAAAAEPASDWVVQQVGVGIPGGDELCVAMRLNGKGKVWVDEVVVERFSQVSGRSAEPLSDQSVDNLVALARLWGAIRWFHPDVEALGVDMDAALVQAIGPVEAATDRVRLEGALRKLVLPLEGSVRIGDPPFDPPPPAVEPEGEDAIRIVPGGDLPDLQGVAVVYLDLRSGAPLPTELVEHLLSGKVRLPPLRHLRYLGFGDVTGTYERTVVKERLPKVEGGEFQPEVYVLTDGSTDPAVGPGVMVLQASGQARLVGAWVPVWPEEPLRVELAPGLDALFSLGSIGSTLEPDLPCAGGLALGVAKDAREGKTAAWTMDAPEPPSLGDEPLTHDQRQARLADLIAAWAVLEHFYPCWEEVDTDWDAALAEGLREAATAADPEAFDAALEHMVSRAADGHAVVRVPGSELPGQVPGVGLEVVDGHLVVATVSEAAAAAGVTLGMELLSVDGQDAQLLLAQALSRSQGATEAARLRQALDGLLERRAGQVKSVTLGLSPVQPPEPEPPPEPPKRGRHSKEPEPPPREITWALPPLEFAPGAFSHLPAHPTHEVLEGGAHYLDLRGLDEPAWEELAETLETAPGLVLDLRGYPGTAMESVVRSLVDDKAPSPLWEVPVITHPFAPSEEWERSQWTVKPGKPQLLAPTVVLVDEQAVSAAETWLSVLAHAEAVWLVGRPSAGTNGTVTGLRLPAGTRLSFTGMHVLDQDERAHHGVGLVPDVVVTRTLEGIVAGRDEDLDAALQALESPPERYEPVEEPEPAPPEPALPEPVEEAPVEEAPPPVVEEEAVEEEAVEEEAVEEEAVEEERSGRMPLSERMEATEEEEPEERDSRKRRDRKKSSREER